MILFCKKIYNIYPKSKLNKKTYDGIIIAVAHKKFKKMGIKSIDRLITSCVNLLINES